MPFTNGSKVRSFQGGNPLTPIFFQNPHLPKINPAYAPVLTEYSTFTLQCIYKMYATYEFKVIISKPMNSPWWYILYFFYKFWKKNYYY